MLGAVLAAEQGPAWEFVAQATKIVLPFLVGITTIDSTAKLRQLAWVIVLSQGTIAAALNLDYLSGFNRLVEADFAGMDNNTTAAALVTCVGLAFFLGLERIPVGAQGPRVRVRTADGARDPVLAVARRHAGADRHRAQRGSCCSRGVVGITALLALVVFLLLQLSSTEARSALPHDVRRPRRARRLRAEPLAAVADSFDVMTKNPLLGCGPGQWPLIADQYGWPRGTVAHCLWLQTGAELGVPGLALLLTFYGACALRLLPLARQRREHSVGDPWLRHAARMVPASLAGFVVAAQFLSISGLEAPYYVALIGAGALNRRGRARSRAPPSRSSCRSPPPPQRFRTHESRHSHQPPVEALSDRLPARGQLPHAARDDHGIGRARVEPCPRFGVR